MPTILMRLSVRPDPNRPRFEEARWIISEDINVEHLLDFVTSIDRKAIGVWDACVHFLEYLCWQKPRQTVLRSKIEGLPNGHPSKARGLFLLSRLSGSVGNVAEQKRLLMLVLTLERKQRNDFRVAVTLGWLSCGSGARTPQGRDAMGGGSVGTVQPARELAGTSDLFGNPRFVVA